MYRLFIAKNNALRETLTTTLEAAGIAVEAISELSDLHAALDEGLTDFSTVH